jgi:hypothetical protein
MVAGALPGRGLRRVALAPGAVPAAHSRRGGPDPHRHPARRPRRRLRLAARAHAGAGRHRRSRCRVRPGGRPLVVDPIHGGVAVHLALSVVDRRARTRGRDRAEPRHSGRDPALRGAVRDAGGDDERERRSRVRVCPGFRPLRSSGAHPELPWRLRHPRRRGGHADGTPPPRRARGGSALSPLPALRRSSRPLPAASRAHRGAGAARTVRRLAPRAGGPRPSCTCRGDRDGPGAHTAGRSGIATCGSAS